MVSRTQREAPEPRSKWGCTVPPLSPAPNKASRRRLSASAPLPLFAAPDAWRSVPEAQRKKLQENLSSQGVESPYKIIPPVEKPKS